MQKLPRTAPEEQGVASADIERFLDSCGQIRELHSFILMRHGSVIAEGSWHPYRGERPHMLYSLSKSFTATAVGLVQADGLLALETPVVELFPEDAPRRPDAHLAAMTVRHLLTMSTGHAEDATHATLRTSGSPYRAFFRVPVEHEPGTHFVYNSAASFMLSAIVQRLTGQTLVDYLTPRLFDPLGIKRPVWESYRNGVNFGGWGLFLRTEDIARLGQLYLQRGRWKKRRLLPEAWVEEATRAQVPNGTNPDSDWNQGYGYQFWRCRHGAYRGDGAFGQYCIVMPEQDAVLAINAGVGDMQLVLDRVWERLLPALGRDERAPDANAASALARREEALAHPAPEWGSEPELARQVSGVRYAMDPNDLTVATLTFDFGARTLTYRLLAGGTRRGTHTLRFGAGEWVAGEATLGAPAFGAVSCAGCWTADGRFELVIRYVETPHVLTLSACFEGSTVMVERSWNVTFERESPPPLTGAARSGSRRAS